jgi:hypothetical protein
MAEDKRLVTVCEQQQADSNNKAAKWKNFIFYI